MRLLLEDSTIQSFATASPSELFLVHLLFTGVILIISFLTRFIVSAAIIR
jgi:hypothetical protein